MKQDITFCGSDCTKKSCMRHHDNIQPPDAIRSFADFSKHCPDYRPPQGNQGEKE